MSEEYRYLKTMPHFVRDGVPLLTGFKRDRIAPYVVLAVKDPLVVGDGAEEDSLAAALDNAEVSAKTGLFTTVTGTYDGAPVSIVSGGSGSPEAELALMDLFNFTDCTTVIRIGGCGAWSPKVGVGDIVISSGAVRDEGMTKAHVRAEYPAVADWQVVGAMKAVADEVGHPYHIGITRSGDSEYCGWGKPGPGGYLQEDHKQIIDYWSRAGVLNTDREAAAILTLCSLYGRRGGAVCSVGDNVVTGELHKSGSGQTAAITVGLSALARLFREDANG
ncbi:nucleoside phosphorylase [Martelella lutilitoris]|uniref:Uridine phosphorylase n=1 Tax=Martelella lutilitoris TaxID=2583532 RepID=A0A7T7HLX7_9HYPH|nr:nucleoside phosphorylase [Martelella lutilitoris]QQM31629.1 nucleoside phosphorylase [Martelella lutilitoris]